MHSSREESVDGVRLLDHAEGRVEDHVLFASLFPPTSHMDIPLLEQQSSDPSQEEIGILSGKEGAEFVDPQEVGVHGQVALREWPFYGDFRPRLPRAGDFTTSHNVLVVSLTALLMAGLVLMVFLISYVGEKIRLQREGEQSGKHKHGGKRRKHSSKIVNHISSSSSSSSSEEEYD